MSLLQGYVADPVSGQFVSEKHMTVATIINDYNPNLSLVWIPPAARAEFDKGHEFAVIHTDPEQYKQYVVMYVGEDEVDERLLAKLWMNDTRRTDVLARLEFEDHARAMIEEKAREEAAAQRIDTVATVMKSPLHTYKMPSGRKISK